MVEKTIDVKAKISLQLSSKTKKINSKCLKGYKLSAKKEKKKARQEHWDKDKDKIKFHNFFLINNQPQTQASKKNKRHGNH